MTAVTTLTVEGDDDRGNVLTDTLRLIDVSVDTHDGEGQLEVWLGALADIGEAVGGDTPVEALKIALQAALGQGIPVAAAAGNQGTQGSPAHYPAALDLPGLVAVGALDRNLSPASYSTQGVYVDLAAPGTGLECVTPGGGQGQCTGTSFATPLVAGAMALWLSAQRSCKDLCVRVRV